MTKYQKNRYWGVRCDLLYRYRTNISILTTYRSITNKKGK